MMSMFENMFDEFKAELTAALTKAGAPRDIIDELIFGYDAEFSRLTECGKSEFEVIVSFGDPEDIARELASPDNVKSAEDELLENPLVKRKKSRAEDAPDASARQNDADCVNDGKPVKSAWLTRAPRGQRLAVLALLWSFAAVGFVFLLGLAGFIVYSAVPYLWQSFAKFETSAGQWGAFSIAVISLLVAAFLIFLVARIAVTAIKFSRGFVPKSNAEKASKKH